MPSSVGVTLYFIKASNNGKKSTISGDRIVFDGLYAVRVETLFLIILKFDPMDKTKKRFTM